MRLVFFKTLSDLLLIMYYLLDHPIYLKRIGVLPHLPDKLIAKLEHYKNIFRLAGRVINILIDIVDLHHIQKEIKDLTKKTLELSKSKAELDTE